MPDDDNTIDRPQADPPPAPIFPPPGWPYVGPDADSLVWREGVELPTFDESGQQ